MAVAAGVVPDAEAPPWGMLAEALEANRQLSELAEGVLEENARLRAALAEVSRGTRYGTRSWRLRADFTVLQRLLFGR